MSGTVLVKDGLVLDVVTGAYDEVDLLAVDGRIVDARPGLAAPAGARTLDARGRYVLPGLIDAHVHVTAATADLATLGRWSPAYVALTAARELEATLLRGFTTVRDAGGADHGLAAAVRDGLVRGPRLLFCGKAISQTGGHADGRGPDEHVLDDCGCTPAEGRVADGVDAVRLAARDELRKGAHHLKVMASGGVASPTDRIDSTQYSMAELRAVVEEAEAANRYVAAHAYSARAVMRAVAAGVRSIEHGNLIDDEAVASLLEHGAFLVPTLVTYWALDREGARFGLPPESQAKLAEVLDAGLGALERAARAGVRIVLGTDLLAGMRAHQREELRIRSEVLGPLSVIRSATVTAAELVGLEGEIGTLAPGALADLLVVDRDPLTDIGALADPARPLRAVVAAGEIVATAPA
ncbi:MAG: amidohydrolase family protein [Frankiaceae bacterium]